MLTNVDLALVGELLAAGGNAELVRAVGELRRILDEHRESVATAAAAAAATTRSSVAVYGRHGADTAIDSYVSSEEDEDYQTSFVSSLSHSFPSLAQLRARKAPRQRNKIRGIVAAAPLVETKEDDGFSELKRMFDEIESQQLVCEENTGKRRRPKTSPVVTAKAPWPAKKKPRA